MDLSIYNKLTRQSARALLEKYAQRLTALGHRDAQQLLNRWTRNIRPGAGPTNRAEKFNFWQDESYYKAMEADRGAAIRRAYEELDKQAATIAQEA